MKNMGLTVPKCVLIVLPKIPQMSKNLFAQLVCPNPKVPDFNDKKLYWPSVVREQEDCTIEQLTELLSVLL